MVYQWKRHKGTQVGHVGTWVHLRIKGLASEKEACIEGENLKVLRNKR
jgi:hypothetical protein